MKKNGIFTFTAPNGAEVTAVAVYAITLFDGNKFIGNKWICYAQNRLFAIMDYKEGIKKYEGIITDYAILPDYDVMLEDYYQHEENIKTVQIMAPSSEEKSPVSLQH